MKHKSLKIYISILISMLAVAWLIVIFQNALGLSGNYGVLEMHSLSHPLGTNQMGQDITKQLATALLSSLSLGLCCGVASLFLGGVLGMIAGVANGRLSANIVLIFDFFLSLPELVCTIIFATFFGGSKFALVGVIVMFSFSRFGKIVCEKTKSISKRESVTIAKAYGGKGLYIAKNHILPEIYPLLLSLAISQMSRGILAESSLAFLGLSDPTATTLGLMLGRGGAFEGVYFTSYYQTLILPPAITLVVVLFTLRQIAREVEKL